MTRCLAADCLALIAFVAACLIVGGLVALDLISLLFWR